MPRFNGDRDRTSKRRPLQYRKRDHKTDRADPPRLRSHAPKRLTGRAARLDVGDLPLRDSKGLTASRTLCGYPILECTGCDVATPQHDRCQPDVADQCRSSLRHPAKLPFVSHEFTAPRRALRLRTARMQLSSRFPPGTSQCNKIDHRLFCEIMENWRGKGDYSIRSRS